MLRITMEQITRNSAAMENVLMNLRNELNILKSVYNEMRTAILIKENKNLSQQLDKAKAKLIQLETSNGIKQYSISNVSHKLSEVTNEVKTENNIIKAQSDNKNESDIKEKAPKKEKKKAEKKPIQNDTDLPIDVGRLDLRVGQIMEIEKHPDADSLYVSKIQCGDPSLRTVVSGLVKYVPINALKNRKVVVLCNLKTVKMRGINSEGMVMCASTPEKVEVLIPPIEAVPGDLIECEGYTRQPDAQMNPKKKIFETVAPDLKTNNKLQACYKERLLVVPSKGIITTESLTNVNIK